MTSEERHRAKRINEGIRSLSSTFSNAGLALITAGVVQRLSEHPNRSGWAWLMLGLLLIVTSSLMPYFMLPDE